MLNLFLPPTPPSPTQAPSCLYAFVCVISSIFVHIWPQALSQVRVLLVGPELFADSCNLEFISRNVIDSLE